jgi:hypothetical protein
MDLKGGLAGKLKFNMFYGKWISFFISTKNNTIYKVPLPFFQNNPVSVACLSMRQVECFLA